MDGEVEALKWISSELLLKQVEDPALKTKFVPHGTEYYEFIVKNVRKALGLS